MSSSAASTAAKEVVSLFRDVTISSEYWKLVEKFNCELNKLHRLACGVCNEIDFKWE